MNEKKKSSSNDIVANSNSEESVKSETGEQQSKTNDTNDTNQTNQTNQTKEVIKNAVEMIENSPHLKEIRKNVNKFSKQFKEEKSWYQNIKICADVSKRNGCSKNISTNSIFL